MREGAEAAGGGPPPSLLSFVAYAERVSPQAQVDVADPHATHHSLTLHTVHHCSYTPTPH